MIRLRTQKLLSGVSALAALMTFGAAGAQAGTTFSGPGAVDPIDTSNATQVPDTSSVVINNNADVGVDADGISFLNKRTTPGLILLGGGATTALLVTNSILEGSVVNGGLISSTSDDAILVANSTILGGIANSESILSTGESAIEINNSLVDGGIHNELHGVIKSFSSAILLTGNTVFTGGITNAGSIDVTGTGVNTVRLDAGVSFSGGIVNTANGGIWGYGDADAISIGSDSFEGGISNAGLIVGQGGAGYAIDVESGTFTGGITNAASGIIQVTGPSGIAIDVENSSFEGGIVNLGLIDAQAASADGIIVSADTFTGGISNAGSIVVDNGTGIEVTGGNFEGGIHNSGDIISGSGTGIYVAADNFSGGITNEEGGTIQGADDAIYVNGTLFTGGISNAGLITSTSSSNGIDVNAATFNGGIVNSGTIVAGGSTEAAAINVRGNSFNGGISNSGLIEGGSTQGAIDVTGASFNGGIQNSGSIIGDGNNAIFVSGDSFTGGITNESGGLINSSSNAIELVGTTFSGGISNAGIIGGTTSGNADVAIHVGTIFQGGITNDESGVIQGETNGILVDGTSFSGGIHNAGLIKTTNVGTGNSAIAITGGTFDGGIENSGTIRASQTVINITNSSFTGGISNSGLIESTTALGVGTAISYNGTSFTGGISNTGSILGANIAINLNGTNFDGGIYNDGRVQSKGTQATAILVTTTTFSGGITNTANGIIQAGDVDGTAAAIVLDGATFNGGIVNAGLIQGGTSSGIGIDAATTTFTGGISNTGTIQGGATGIFIHGTSFTGGLHNDGGIIRTSGSGQGVKIASTTFNGGVSNSGLIKGIPGLTNGGTGLLITSNTFNGGIDNSGTISGDDPGLLVTSANFTGGVSNSGLISGTNSDGARLHGTNFTGGIHNSGSIGGSSDGLDVDYTNFHGDISNTSSGKITGDRGAVLSGGNYVGNVLNAGLIDGSSGEGLRLAMDQLAGDVTNSGTITARYDAFKIAGGTTVTGDVANEGYISSSSSDSVDINGIIEGSFSNSGLIETSSGNGIDIDGVVEGGIFNSGTILSSGQGAVDLTGEGAAHTLTQTAGLISDGGGELGYAIDMANGYEDTFYANGGVVEGNIYAGGGEGDHMITQSGTFAWAYGTTDGSGLNNLDVNEDGTMILGSYERGDGFGGVVTADALSMALDGHLHLGDYATVNVDSLAQSETGDVEYFLTTDVLQHGQINVNGGVTGADLSGTASVYVDAATFADSKYSGDVDFTYEDVLTSTALSGNFSNSTALTTNSLFFTAESVDSGSDSLDINLHRVAFADVLDNDGETENQNAVGDALDTIFSGGEFSGDFQDLIEGLLANGLTPEEIQAIYDELGGAEHAQLQNTTLGLSGLLGTLIGDRLDATLPGLGGNKSASLAFRQFADGTDGKTATDATPPASYGNRGLNTGASGASIWAKGFGNWTKADGDTEATGYDQNTGGAALGLDFAVASNVTLGLAGSWSTTDVSFDTAGDDATVDTWQGGLYGSVGMGRFYIDGSATYSAHDLSVDRLVDLPDPATPFVASSNYNATAWSLNGEFGGIFRVGRIDLQPSAALAYTSLSTDGFTETGDNDAFNLLVQGSDANSFASTLAVRGSGQFMMGRTRVMPDVKLGWRHDFGDDRQTFTAAFEEDPSVPFEIISSKTSQDAAVVNAGITAAVTKSLEVFVDLNGQYSGDVTTSNAAGGVRFTW